MKNLSLAYTLLLCMMVTCISGVHAQTCARADFAGCSNNGGGCPTFTSCDGWVPSHGTPELNPNPNAPSFVQMIGNIQSGQSTSEGILMPFTFEPGNNYDVLVSYSFFGGSSPASGSFTVYAANGVVPEAPSTCQQVPPAALHAQPFYSLTANNQDYDNQTGLGTITQISSVYNQVWVYPNAASGADNVNLEINYIAVCTSCYAVTTYATGTLPAQINGKDITIEIPAANTATVVQASDAIFLNKGFKATASGTETFTAEINANCATNQQPLALFRTRDSSALISRPVVNPAATDSAAGSIRIYPTFGNGTFFLDGSLPDLNKADIIVFDATGKAVYRLHNETATRLELDLGHLASGMYFVQIRKATGSLVTKKIIIDK